MEAKEDVYEKDQYGRRKFTVSQKPKESVEPPDHDKKS